MAAFVKPALSEIAEYAKEIGFTSLDPNYFYWYHEQTGWIDKNKRPYVNWRGILQVWYRAALQRGEIKDPKEKTFKDMYESTKDTDSQNS